MPRIFADPPNAASRRVPGLLLAMLVLLWLPTGSKAFELRPINGSRAEYDAELAKWNSLHVVEYEVVARDIFDVDYGIWAQWKAIVYVDPACGKNAESITQFEYLGNTFPNGPDGSTYVPGITQDNYIVRDTTADGLLQMVDYYLLDPPPYPEVRAEPNPIAVQIAFDANMGYPRSIVFFGDDGSKHESRIVELKVLKRSGNI